MKRKGRKKPLARDTKLTQRKAFYVRIRTISEKMVGAGYFDLFPERSLRLMSARRYPPIKVVLDGRRVMTDEEALRYRRSLVELFSNRYVETFMGERISYTRFLTDALVLIHHVQYGIDNRFRGASALIRAFGPYFTNGDWYRRRKEEALQLMGLADLQLYDFYRGTVRSRADGMAVISPGQRNVIRVYRLPHQTGLLNIDGRKRVITKLGIPSQKEIRVFDWPLLRPSDLGFEGINDSVAMPLYAQQHAFNRFKERTSFPSGYVLTIFTNLFTNGKPHFRHYEGRSLLECYIGKHKVGYFVITPHDGRWVVRTFLFLTNDGTPEGRKLADLTNWQRMDRKYLMVDRMDAFLAYDISGDAGLRKLFVKAGCGSLLRFADELTALAGITPESANYIYKYMIRMT
ncbi:hypothetical protein QT327_07040 [Olivibacter sp. 47]|uniref:Uncharacterized protein n=1 Tax=Sphingobacterium sp. (strain 21) TaxID=743722 RepID=F4CF43_SPHS2|nr:hypothetical protein [Olivibacter sp. 47]MDM8174111.1 hypothetical protein [Olivibacter sp. 47]